MSKSPREIMFVIGTLLVGGTELHLASIAPELVKAGWRVSLYTLSKGGPLADEITRRGVTVLRPPLERGQLRASLPMRIFRLAVCAFHLLFTIIRRRPQVVHFFLPESYLVGAPVAIAGGTRIRVMSRRSLNEYQKERPLYRRLESLLHPWMTAIVGNSKRIVDQLHNDENVPNHKLHLIYNGIDVARFRGDRNTARGALSISPEALVLVIVANLIPYKGHFDLISALSLSQHAIMPNWRLLVVGRDDGIGQSLQQKAIDSGIGKNVLFLGERQDTPSMLAAADMGILCSHQEGFSNAVLEKMASGLPLIVTDVGGNAEAVVDGVTGLVVPPRDPHRLAEAILKLANDPEMRQKFGTAGRARVAEHFTLERCVQAYDEFYRSLLRGQT